MALAAVLATAQPSAHANGRALRFITQTAGPYQIAAGTIPSPPVVGFMHLTMEITDKDAKTPVLGADVIVTGTGPGENKPAIGPMQAAVSPTDIGFYDINTNVDEVGPWTFNVAISGQLGQAESDFVIEVETANPLVRVFTWVTIVVFLAVVGLGLLPLIRQRARRRERRRRTS